MFILFLFLIFFNHSLQMDSRVEFQEGTNINPTLHILEHPQNDKRLRDNPDPE